MPSQLLHMLQRVYLNSWQVAATALIFSSPPTVVSHMFKLKYTHLPSASHAKCTESKCLDGE
jgi:hypothetical protein